MAGMVWEVDMGTGSHVIGGVCGETFIKPPPSGEGFDTPGQKWCITHPDFKQQLNQNGMW